MITPTNQFSPFRLDEVEQSVGSRFERQVALHGDRLAVKTSTAELTYRDLNQLANRYAHAILDRCKGECRVALLLDHDAPLIAALLGVMKAGKVCVPLDPSHPISRASYILDDTECDLILTNDRNLPLARQFARNELQWINVDELGAAQPIHDPHLALSPDTLAYILYTSGSTGQPKGVMQPHRNLMRGILGFTNGLHIGAEDRIVLLSSCSSGQGMTTTFTALLNGAALLPFAVREEGVDKLATWIEREAITVYMSAATVFRHFVRSTTVHDGFPSMRAVRLGSEPVNRIDVELYRKHFGPHCLFCNALSSTETGNITQLILDKETEIQGDLVPVGYPVDGVEVLLLDDDGNDVGFDREGEIVTRSYFLSPGYWRKPEETRAAFSDSPEGDGKQIFRTGDLGVRRPDGCLVHRGRKDFRVKVRGYRIEVEEIEAALNHLSAVQAAAVTARQDGFGDNHLVAHVVPRQGQPPSLTELRTHLRGKLPEHMVPTVFVMHEVLPMTPNGKADRAALASMNSEPLVVEKNTVAPRSPLEEQLVRIWEEVVPYRPIGVRDSFFDVGGHSLTATLVVSRVRAAFSIDLPLREFLENPTIEGLVVCLARKRDTANRLVEPPLRPVAHQGDIPLSFAQQRLWFLDQLEPGNTNYNLPRAIRLIGSLNEAALERTLGEITRRHEVLRTSFATVRGNPVQHIAPPQPVLLPRVDARSLPDALAMVKEETSRPFDLQRGPLFRGLLIRIGENDHILLLTMHHIISDRWSRWLITQELAALYEAFSLDKPSPLPELPIQYADFAVWQRQWLQGEVMERQLGYWRKQLGGELPVLELPTDQPRPAVMSSRGAVETFVLSSSLAQTLKALGHCEGSTLFMTLFAAFETLLHRYTGQEDFAVGAPIANRNRVETEKLIGFFVNTLVLCANMTGNPSFRELLTRVRETALEAYAHQDVPFEKLVEELSPRRDPSHSPLFQVTFALQNAPDQELTLHGLKVQPLPVENDTAKFDLSLAMFEEATGLRGVWEFNTDLFDAATIRRMIGHFTTLIEGIAANPDLRLSELPLLTETERNQLLVEWNKTDTQPTDDRCVHETFEAQAASAPDAVAVICGDQRLTYWELNARANRIAHCLRTQGVGPEVLVAMSVERSADMIAGLLGIWKAGGVYVPIDPSYPRERVEFILNDTQAAVFMADEKLRECVHNGNEVNPGNHATRKQLAYVIYTSGSTGTPKGVAVTHGAIADHCRTVIPHYRLTRDDRVLQFASLSFDVSLEQILSTLLAGATLAMRGNDMWSGDEFTELVARHRLTVVNLPPAYWHEWVRSLTPSTRLEHLRLVICGGEAMSRESVRLWQQSSLSDVRLLNAYGPTEATITATTYEVPTLPGDTFSRGWIPIGRPLPNRTAFILDCHRNPVPIGITGELHIGGDSLARGYLNRPELTTGKFIRNPFSNTHGDRLYNTGDLARYRADGTIEFMGRIDQQVKLRGFRIEPGEIEAVLTRHPDVKTAVVVVSQKTETEKDLIAYVVPTESKGMSAAGLREFVRQQLPEYMVPSAFIPIDSVPLTSNGKINRPALPSPTREVDAAVFSAPRNDIEQRLAAIFCTVLHVERVGIHDNFFELGGHSLLVVQMVSRVRHAFAVEVPIVMVFTHPTVAALAVAIAEQVANTSLTEEP